MKITEFPEVSTLDLSNIFIVDGPNGTKKISMENFPFAVLDATGAEVHRMVFRGKNLGDRVTTEQATAIREGTFDDLWLGDYWVINGHNWRIWDFNYWLHCGDTEFVKHHLVLMPDKSLYSAQMNATHVTTGGYMGSAMYTSGLAGAKTMVTAAFSDLVLAHRELLVNAVTSGYASAGAWCDSTVELPNEPMMYGSYVHSPAGNGTMVPYRYTISKTQLALGMIAPKFICNRENYWLRDVVSASSFARVTGGGNTYYSGASNSYGVRPVFPIG